MSGNRDINCQRDVHCCGPLDTDLGRPASGVASTDLVRPASGVASTDLVRPASGVVSTDLVRPALGVVSTDLGIPASSVGVCVCPRVFTGIACDSSNIVKKDQKKKTR